MSGNHSEANSNGQLYRELFDRVPIGLYRTTPDGEIIDVNPALVRMLGYPDRDTLLAEAAGVVYVHPHARDGWRAEMDRKGTVSGLSPNGGVGTKHRSGSRRTHTPYVDLTARSSTTKEVLRMSRPGVVHRPN